MGASIHTAVMTQEVMHALKPQSGGNYLDATLGGGTHSRELLELSAPHGRILSLDVDPMALERAKTAFAGYGQRWIGQRGNFRDMAEIAEHAGFLPLDGILLDLGFSSDELSDPQKGLSFATPGPLDMRLDPTNELTAAEIVNGWKESELARIIAEYGEEKFARRIAKALIAARKTKKILRTTELAEIIVQAVPRTYERGRIHPATRTFQALRIAVNDELGALEAALKAAPGMLKPGGIIAAISFHSLEDRLVKRAFRDAHDLEPLYKKPLVPSAAEIAANPRSRSAKLRAAKKIEPNTKRKNTNKYDVTRLFHDPAI
ncbi:MAG: 16S rRNA (cytosine(1402)-N(4))-methyltransferase RsmH [Patescibacteria group bacterium]